MYDSFCKRAQKGPRLFTNPRMKTLPENIINRSQGKTDKHTTTEQSHFKRSLNV